MPSLSFEDYSYFPALRTRVAELKGLTALDRGRKSKIVPLLTLGRWPKAADFARSAEKAAESMGELPYFLDLTADPQHLAGEQAVLRDPANAFAAWRAFVGTYQHAVPVLMTSPTARMRDMTRQAQELEGASGSLAIRIRDFAGDSPVAISVLSAMADPRNAMVFIDCQYIRNALPANVAATIATINQLRREFPEIFIAVLATSFPSTVTSFADASGQRGAIEILEREFHQRIGGSTVAAYGDHGSIHSVVYDSTPIMRWSARIDYPRELEWYFERRPGDQTSGGFISAAQAVVATDPDLGTRGVWGEQMIRDAAEGNLHGKAPASWIAVRVNIHLARQIELSERMALDDALGDDPASDDWLNEPDDE